MNSSMSDSLVVVFRTCLIVHMALMTNSADAQFRLDIERVADQAFIEPDTIDEEMATERIGVVQLRRNRLVAGPDMERLVFRNHRTEKAARASLEQRLKAKIDRLDRTAKLTEQQKKKLRLAGQGDIALLLASTARFERDFGGVAMQDRDQLMRMLQELRPIQKRMTTDIFVEGSVFDRVWLGMQDAKQKQRFQQAKRRVMHNFYKGAAKHAITKIERQMPLAPKQREQLMDLMLAETNMPKIRNFSSSRNGAKYMVAFAIYQLAKHRPELAQILKKQQLEAIKPTLKQAMAMEETLTEAGYLE